MAAVTNHGGAKVHEYVTRTAITRPLKAYLDAKAQPGFKEIEWIAPRVEHIGPGVKITFPDTEEGRAEAKHLRATNSIIRVEDLPKVLEMEI